MRITNVFGCGVPCTVGLFGALFIVGTQTFVVDCVKKRINSGALLKGRTITKQPPEVINQILVEVSQISPITLLEVPCPELFSIIDREGISNNWTVSKKLANTRHDINLPV